MDLITQVDELDAPLTALPGPLLSPFDFYNAISSTSIMDLAHLDFDYSPMPHISIEHLPRASASAYRFFSSDKRKASSDSPEFDLDISDTLHTKKSHRVCAVGRPSRHVLKGRCSRMHNRQQTLAPSPEPIYRSSRSRSTSCFPFTRDFPYAGR